MQDEYSTIRLTNATKARLDDRGKKNDSYESIVVRLLEHEEELEKEIYELRKKVHDSNPLMGQISEPIPA